MILAVIVCAIVGGLAVSLFLPRSIILTTTDGSLFPTKSSFNLNKTELQLVIIVSWNNFLVSAIVCVKSTVTSRSWVWVIPKSCCFQNYLVGVSVLVCNSKNFFRLLFKICWGWCHDGLTQTLHAKLEDVVAILINVLENILKCPENFLGFHFPNVHRQFVINSSFILNMSLSYMPSWGPTFASE